MYLCKDLNLVIIIHVVLIFALKKNNNKYINVSFLIINSIGKDEQTTYTHV